MSNLPPEQVTAKSSLICADCGHEEWQHHPFTVMRTCSAMVDLRHAAAGGPLSPCPCKGFDAVTVVKVAARVPVQIQGSPYRTQTKPGSREATLEEALRHLSIVLTNGVTDDATKLTLARQWVHEQRAVLESLREETPDG